MRFNEMIRAIREGKVLKVDRRIECGAESILYFGFRTGRRYHGGSHQKFEEIITTLESVSASVRANYSCCM